MTKSGLSALIVDDEPQIRRFLRAGLELSGFLVREAEDAERGLKSATFHSPDIVILDLGLPDLDGSEVLKRIRAWSNVPVIILSIKSDEDEKVRLLELGADDYMVKPFGMAELLARANAALRRYVRGLNKDPIVQAGPLSIDLVTRNVSINGTRVSLTRKERHLLQLLGEHAGNVITHQHLLREIWGPNHTHSVQYLRVLVRKIRHKIEVDPARPTILVTESGVGYRLVQKDDDVAESPGKLVPA